MTTNQQGNSHDTTTPAPTMPNSDPTACPVCAQAQEAIVRAVILKDQSLRRAGEPVDHYIHFFICTPDAAQHLERALRAAVISFLTPAPGRELVENEGSFDWGHAFEHIPPAVWAQHGLTRCKACFPADYILALDFDHLPTVTPPSASDGAV